MNPIRSAVCIHCDLIMSTWPGIDKLPGETDAPGEESDPSSGRGGDWQSHSSPIPAVGCRRTAALKALCLMALMAHALAMGTSARGAVPDGGPPALLLVAERVAMPLSLCSVQGPAWTPGLQPLGLPPLGAFLGLPASWH